MARNYQRSLNYGRRSFDYRSYNENQRAAAKYGLAGIDEDVLTIFNGLDKTRLEFLLTHYEAAHGESAANYARNKIPEWATGSVRASGQTIQRLMALVPKVLRPDEKYELLKKLYDFHRSISKERHVIFVVTGRSSDFRRQVSDLASKLCQKHDSQQLPSSVQQKISWVCDNDSMVARSIMAAVEKEQSYTIASIGRAAVDDLVRRVEMMDASISGCQTIELPYGTIVVKVRQPTFIEKLSSLFT